MQPLRPQNTVNMLDPLHLPTSDHDAGEKGKGGNSEEGAEEDEGGKGDRRAQLGATRSDSFAKGPSGEAVAEKLMLFSKDGICTSKPSPDSSKKSPCHSFPPVPRFCHRNDWTHLPLLHM